MSETPSNLSTIVVIGHALGDYHNEDVSKEFDWPTWVIPTT